MKEPFYKNGLKFQCQRCSGCCRFEPGYVFLTEDDVTSLLDVLKMERDAFLEKYCVKVDIGGSYRLSLAEKENYDCIFWENGGCSVYEGRPLQCRSYPFWASNLESPEDWDALGCSCPGVNKGCIHTREEIEDWLYQRKAHRLIEWR
ncbi:MAG: YkgJ family cysteine cluster protein [Spirochaetia bacterium]|nr:YkgJ family cysteine cluster protein [Spirochaetia bacterium]